MKTKHPKRLSLSSLLVLLVTGVAAVTVVLSSTVFISLYTAALRNNAATGAEQSVMQSVGAISNYTAGAGMLLERIVEELESETTAQQLRTGFEMMVEMRDDLAGIAVYTMHGELLDCWAPGKVRKERVGTLQMENIKPDAAGLYYTTPHVQNIYPDYYPWVVTIARPVELDRYGTEILVTIDLQFSTIAGYMDDVGIGQHGYSFIMDDNGGLVYHPQQQLIYAGLKQENTEPLASLEDGIYTDADAIRVIRSLPLGHWRIVSVCFLDELVRQPQQTALWLIFCSVSGALCILLAAGLLVARLVSRPIHRLVAQMHDFELAAADFVYTPVSGTSEIGVLSDSFEHLVLRIQNLMDEVKKEEETLRKTELKALQAQINPHFLYNTLDSIQWMCEVGRTEEAVKMVGALARLFRISISRGQDLIPIRKEIEHAESYLIIQKFRYKNQFSYRFEVEESVLDCLCSKITLQPIIENAILHGFGEFVDNGEIVISAKAVGDHIELCVRDNGIGMDSQKCALVLSQDTSGQSGIGIKNVADRIRIFFGAQYGIRVESEPDVGTSVYILLPQIRGEDT